MYIICNIILKENIDQWWKTLQAGQGHSPTKKKNNAKGRENFIGSCNLPASKMTEELTEVLRDRRLKSVYILLWQFNWIKISKDAQTVKPDKVQKGICKLSKKILQLALP